MSRLAADLLLLAAALIWGLGFIAQSTAMDDVGPLTFTGLRFSLAALAVWPLASQETRPTRNGLNRLWTRSRS